MNGRLIAQLMVITVIVLAIMLIVMTIYQRKQATSETIFKKQRTIIDSKQLKLIYTKLAKFPLTRRYVANLSNTLKSYYPGDGDSVVKTTLQIVTISYGVCLIILLVAIAVAPTFYIIACCFITAYLLNKEIVSVVLSQTESKILKELKEFLELLQFYFMQYGMVEESIHDAITGKHKIIERHAAKILRVLDSVDMEIAMDDYINSIRNKYIKELVCICATTYSYGDTVVDKESCFLRNLRSLQDRVNSEILHRNTLEYNFRIIGFIIIPVMFAGYGVKEWAISTIAELEPYLRGQYGVIMSVLTPIICVICYLVQDRLRSITELTVDEHPVLTKLSLIPGIHKLLEQYYTENYGKKLQYEKLLKQVGSTLNVYTLVMKEWLFAFIAFIVSICVVIGMHQYTKIQIENKVTGVGSKSTIVSEECSIQILMLIRHYTNSLLDEDVVEMYNDANSTNTWTITEGVKGFVQNLVLNKLLTEQAEISYEEAFAALMQYNTEHATSTTLYTAYLGSSNGPIREDNASMYDLGQQQFYDIWEEAQKVNSVEIIALNESIASDVAKTVCDYQSAYFHWTELIMCIVLAVLSYRLPYWWILFNKKSIQQRMSTEVIQFQSLIIALMNIKRMSADVILDWMIKFANVFRASLHHCSIYLPLDDNKAYNDLIVGEPFAPLQELVRKLQMCDKVGVSAAFSSLEVIQKNYIKEMEIERERRMQESIMLVELIGLLPWAFILIAFFGYPLIVESSGELNSAFSQIMTM